MPHSRNLSLQASFYWNATHIHETHFNLTLSNTAALFVSQTATFEKFPFEEPFLREREKNVQIKKIKKL
jgi:antitoxin component of RelBE/YafQ-DinJ toxin-antitoxin module